MAQRSEGNVNRITWIAAGVATVVAVAGGTWVVASQVLRSPADLAAEAEPPEPSEVAVPVERTELVADVIVRATVEFAEPQAVSLAGSVDVDGEMIATRVPEEDEEVDEGDVLLEISGRPVFVIDGDVPAFRDLRPGSEGEDVEQLQSALDRLGYEVEVDGVFGSGTAGAIDAWYGDAGFAAAGPSEEELDQLDQAEERRTTAEDQLAQAEAQLAQAREGPSRSEELQARSQVSEAEDALDDLPDDASDADVRRAEEQLEIAIATYDELLETPDASVEQRAVETAQAERDEAQEALERVQARTGTWVPAGELVVIEDLPQRVDGVEVARGDAVSGEIATVSSADIDLWAEIPVDDVDLVAEGDAVLLRPDEGEELEGEVVELAEQPGTHDAAEDAHAARIEPLDDAEELLGTSVRVQIPVSGTDGEVLAVPLVAISAGADGTSRVEVVEGGEGEDPEERRIVDVEPGLSADGLVEVTPIDGELEEGDQVVVGS